MSYHFDENEFLRALGVSSKDLEQKSTNQIQSKNKRRKFDDYTKIYRMVRLEMLSRPMCRKLQPWPNPKFEVNYD